MAVTHYLLRPVNPYFIAFSLFLGLLFNLLPWGGSSWAPDLLSLILIFWSLHQPQKVGLGVAFFCGLLMDVHNGALLGEQALGYTFLSYFSATIHRRVLGMASFGPIVHVFLLLMAMKLLLLCLHAFLGARYPGWTYFMPVLVGSALWPLISALLLMPQRRPDHVDTNRPI